MNQLGKRKFEMGGAFLMATILVAGCFALSVPANAQGRGGHRGGGVERELNELTQVLALSGDQQAQVKTLLEERRAQVQSLRSGEEPPSREQMMAIRKDTNNKIRALLNDDQKAKFEAWQQQRMEQRRGQEGEEAPGAQPPGI